MKNILKLKRERCIYLVRCHDKIAKSVYYEIGRYFSTKYVHYHPCLNDESYVEFISTRSEEDILERLDKVFGNVCTINKENGTIVMEMKAA